MNLDLMMMRWQGEALTWWQSLGPDGPYYLWLASGALFFLFFGWFAHRVMRKAVGHRQFRGTWYTESQFETLVKMIDEDSQRGNRVMRHDEMQVLRQWRFGSSKSISDGGKGYF